MFLINEEITCFATKGVTLLDRARNEEVLREMKVEKLDGVLREVRLRRFGHVWRRDYQYVRKQVMRMTVERRERGRPRRRWKDCVEEDMRSLGLCAEEAKDRSVWRRRIRTGKPN